MNPNGKTTWLVLASDNIPCRNIRVVLIFRAGIFYPLFFFFTNVKPSLFFNGIIHSWIY